MVGVLPQGGTHSEFGHNFDPKSYSEDVFTRLVALGFWKQAPETRVVWLTVNIAAGRPSAGLMGEKPFGPNYHPKASMLNPLIGRNDLNPFPGGLSRQRD